MMLTNKNIIITDENLEAWAKEFDEHKKRGELIEKMTFSEYVTFIIWFQELMWS